MVVGLGTRDGEVDNDDSNDDDVEPGLELSVVEDSGTLEVMLEVVDEPGDSD